MLIFINTRCPKLDALPQQLRPYKVSFLWERMYKNLQGLRVGNCINLVYFSTPVQVHFDPFIQTVLNTNIFRHFCCGPSSPSANCCPAGARTVGPCSHVAAILLVGCVLPHNPDTYRPTHRDQNILDPGDGLPLAAALGPST